jgi:hypothetical protein
MQFYFDEETSFFEKDNGIELVDGDFIFNYFYGLKYIITYTITKSILLFKRNQVNCCITFPQLLMTMRLRKFTGIV